VESTKRRYLTDAEAEAAMKSQEIVLFEDLEDNIHVRKRVHVRIVKRSHGGWNDRPVWKVVAKGGSETLCSSESLHCRLTLLE